MKIVESKHEKGIVVPLDDNHFVNCAFENCTLVYSGGEWQHNNTVFKDCPMTFSGPAQRTINLLMQMGLMKPPQMPNQPSATVNPPKLN